jgi:hypothetical protein
VTPAQRKAWERYHGRLRELGTVQWDVLCDGPGCRQTFFGTHAQRRKAGWTTRWRREDGSGLEIQVDLCPQCRRGAGVWPPMPKAVAKPPHSTPPSEDDPS